jgi:hypothetical protein
MTHASRPLHIGRAFAQLQVSPPDFSSYTPTRESDGQAHVGTMLDLRQLRIADARADALESLNLARDARLRGAAWAWERHMEHAAASRRQFAGLKRSGGRVNWRGQPSEVRS